MARLLAPSASLLLLLLAAAPAWAEPALARAHLRDGEASGAVFFLSVPQEPGAVAVGAAHAFDATRLAESGELALRRDGETRAVARRYFAAPGRAYHRPGASLRDDFVVFALEAAPRGMRRLEPAATRPPRGERVRILGMPPEGGADVVLTGTVARSEEDAIEVDLARRPDLRGWGGAPVLAEESGRVVGLLQSAWPQGEGLRLGVAPIGGVVAALERPFEAGLGRLFASLAPPPSAATDPGWRRRAATGSPYGDPSPARTAAEVVAAATRRGPSEPPTLRVEIEHPRPGAVVGASAGAFVAGRAGALRGGTRRLDVVIAIDTSVSTAQPAGVDVDGDGVLGAMPVPAPRDAGEARSTDPGDSILAAEVAAAKELLEGLDARATRVGIVTFAGDPVQTGPLRIEVQRAAQTEEPLTSDYDRLRQALDRVRDRGAGGMTYMAAGIDQASLELLGLAGSISHADDESEKVVLFFTDGTPTLPEPGHEAGNVRSVLQAARRARRAGVRIHAFAIGPEALEGPVSTVEMAAITAGLFTPVRDPGQLVRFMDLVSFARVEALEVENETTKTGAYATRLQADGSWDALVPLAPGENTIEVRARSGLGEEARERITVTHRPGEPGAPMPAELLPRQNALLERRLDALRQVRAERMRKELVIEMERERAAALERAERQRKELEIEAWRPDAP
jgi:hypothetical protein